MDLEGPYYKKWKEESNDTIKTTTNSTLIQVKRGKQWYTLRLDIKDCWIEIE